jgi:glycogenin glucosyltransferase
MRVARCVGIFTFLAIIAYFYMLVKFSFSSHHHISPRGVAPVDPIASQTSPRYAFAVLLCDDVMAIATMTLVRSVKKTGTTADVVVCILPTVSAGVRGALSALGARVNKFAPVQYPFMTARSTENIRDNKACRYAKLRIWGMTEYSKIVYLDADVLVLKNIDSLFQYAELSATQDKYPGVFNSGVMVLEPSKRTMQAMIESYLDTKSYNKGDQGFLNSFFSRRASSSFLKADEHPDHRTRLSFHPLPAVFNMPVWLKRSPFGAAMNLSDVRVVHFTAEVKPWTFFWRSHRGFDAMFDSQLFYTWNRLAAEMATFLGVNHTLPPAGLPQKPLPAWMHSMCDVAARNAERQLISNAFTIVISTFRGERLPLGMLVTMYGEVPGVHRVIVIWHDPTTLPTIESNPRSLVPIHVHHTKSDSLNNRFLPLSFIETEGVLSLDDDIITSPKDIYAAFSLWKKNSQQLIGPFLRTHVPQFAKSGGKTYLYAMHDARKQGSMYSMVLTKFLFAPTKLFFMFTCLMPRYIHEYIDSITNCEDIAFNILASVVLRAPPLGIGISTEDWGRNNGISTSSTTSAAAPHSSREGNTTVGHGIDHMQSRSTCLTHLIKMFQGAVPLGAESVVTPNMPPPKHLYVNGMTHNVSISTPHDAGAPSNMPPALIGRTFAWGNKQVWSSLDQQTTNACSYCGHFVASVTVYRASSCSSNCDAFAGIRFGVQNGNLKDAQRTTGRLHSSTAIRPGELIAVAEWSVNKADETIQSIEVSYDAKGPITGLRFVTSEGVRSPLIGNLSGNVNTVHVPHGLCGVRVVFGRRHLEAAAFLDSKSSTECSRLIGNEQQLINVKKHHVLSHDECAFCDRQVTKMAFWTRLGNGSRLAAIQVEFGSLMSTNRYGINRKLRHVTAPRHGCGLALECNFVGTWEVSAPHFIARVHAHFTDASVTGMSIENSDGAVSPLFGTGGEKSELFNFNTGICGIEYAAGASIDALAFKARGAFHTEWGISCEQAFFI